MMITESNEYEDWLGQHLSAQQLNVDVPLYHYTDAAGLLGILEEGNIWHTSLCHVNDPSEERFGKNIAFQILDEFTSKNFLFKTYSDEIRRNLTSPDFCAHFEPFVSCFSKDRNTLEQWRAYGDDGRGFSVGFKPSVFEVKPKPIKTNNTFITQVVYGDAAISLFREPIEKWFNSVPQYEVSDEERNSWLTGLTLAILWYSARTKHEAYKAENEIRLMTRNGGQVRLDKKIRFRAKGASIVPYFEQGIGAHDPKNIHEVIAGPAAADTALDALYTLKRVGRLGGVEVWQSKIPYRAL